MTRIVDLDMLPKGRVEWEDVVKLPVLKPEDVIPTSRWIYMPNFDLFVCKNCTNHVDWNTTFCSACGHRMTNSYKLTNKTGLDVNLL